MACALRLDADEPDAFWNLLEAYFDRSWPLPDLVEIKAGQ